MANILAVDDEKIRGLLHVRLRRKGQNEWTGTRQRGRSDDAI